MRVRVVLAVLAVLAVVGTAALAVPAQSAEPQRTFTYSVATRGVAAEELEPFAAVVREVLEDPRGWSLGGTLGYRRVASGGDLVTVLASPAVVDAAAPVCDAVYSCRVGDTVYVNEARWRGATPSWTLGLAQYRRYVLDHEIGHWHGLGHTDCPRGGIAAAVMQQQSKGLQGCRAAVWPLVGERQAVARNRGVPVTWSAVDSKHLAVGPAVLGSPLTPELPSGVRDGRVQLFERGAITWSPATGAHEVHGGIAERWAALGGVAGPLAHATTDELPTADDRGRLSGFEGSGGGVVVWSPATGAHEVYGGVHERWAALDGVRGPLGYPLTGERTTPDGGGRTNDFTGGAVSWSPATGAHEVYGAIFARWRELGREAGPAGRPISGERSTADGRARVSEFDGTGSTTIVWTPAHGAVEVLGAIRQSWVAHGREAGRLGLPVRPERDVPGGRLAEFEGGQLRWDRGTGEVTVVG